MTTELDLIRRQIRTLRVTTAALTAMLCVLTVSAFRAVGPSRVKELTVERLNVVEANGRPRMIISNSAMAPGYRDKGKQITERKVAGMIFYNDDGIEDGGLIFEGKKSVDGSVSAGGSLTFDAYGSDQVVALQYTDDGGRQRNGLTVTDYPPGDPDHTWTLRREAINRMPEGPAKDSAQAKLYAVLPWRTRAFFGRDFDGSSVLRLAGRDGRARVRLRVDSTDVAHLEFLNASGRIISSLPNP